tara:strand:- start:323 stop:1042 length:720 start_codon:yes stop_codon:yes gene_type:complete
MPRVARPINQLTPEQQINRARNEKAKEKRSMKPKSNLLTISPSPSPLTSSLSSWQGIGILFLNPLTSFYSISILSLSSYLAYQFHQYVDITTGLTVEFLSIVFATLFSVNKKFASFCAGICSILVIVYSSMCLYQGMSNKSGNNNDTINNIRDNRSIVMAQITNTQKTINSLPLNHTTRRNKMQDSINSLKLELLSLDNKIISTKSNVSVDYSAIAIRILAMLANLLLIHRFISYIKEK